MLKWSRPWYQGTCLDLSPWARLLQLTAAILSSGRDQNKTVDLPAHAHVLLALCTCSDSAATQIVQQQHAAAAAD
jgi:hypothetical protein